MIAFGSRRQHGHLRAVEGVSGLAVDLVYTRMIRRHHPGFHAKPNDNRPRGRSKSNIFLEPIPIAT
jgi:hypothetical protein